MKNIIKLIATASLLVTASTSFAQSADDKPSKAAYADPAQPMLSDTPMEITKSDTALVVIDPQIDFLSPEGVSWGAVGESVTEHNVVQHLEDLFSAANNSDMLTFVSPHYYYPHDHEWEFEGKLEKLMHDIKMFDRAGQLNTTGFEGSGADWMPQYKQYIDSKNTIVSAPHKIYGPEQNDLVLQMRKRGINKIILAGMSSNLCVQAHMHELIEQGFEVMVVRDATAGAIIPEGDGYLAALVNFRFMASEVVYTSEAVERIKTAR